MKFNDLKVGMVVGEVLFKGDREMSTNYTIKIIDSISKEKAEVTTYGYSTDAGEYSFFKGYHRKFHGVKDFGLAKPMDDFEIEDKIEFVRAVFESKSKW